MGGYVGGTASIFYISNFFQNIEANTILHYTINQRLNLATILNDKASIAD